ncbi:MAG: GNAT family N-acetyltransferase [Hyphomicrobiales bacterium]|nr:MAG: GNAT family N-acetyltransferase [Hyphomicrobiales bacterium]
MKYILDPADFTDWQELHKLLIECFAYMDELINPPSSLHQMTTDNLRKKAKKEILLVVYDDETLIACAFFDIQKEQIYIGKVAVAQDRRGQGIANKIFKIADNLAHENNKGWLQLKTRIELVDNHKAFERIGFITTAQNSHAGYTRPTYITMRKKLI